jgi:L-alanine-DL-glutamate epimerase-like enolase superfamily enzyme
MPLYELIADLSLRIEGYTLERLARTVSSGFERVTTVIALHGAGETGLGEDVTYEAEAHDTGLVLALEGAFSFDSFSEQLGALDLFPGYSPAQDVFRRYRRWGFESAALDLALRQAGTSLHARLGRAAEPVTFVVSSRMGDPPTLDPVTRRLARYPDLRFKLDGTPDWTDELIAGLQATGAVDSIDFKGAYRGTVVDVQTDPAFYRRIAEAFPQAWLEDPDLETEEARNALAPFQDRITWDAPIHSVADVLAAPVLPRTVNLKPSRFGSVRSLLEAYEFCEQRGMGAYGGGQYELGVGRGHVQLLAALFHPQAPNDIAPGGYDALDPEPGLPGSPLDVGPAPIGFRRAGDDHEVSSEANPRSDSP